MKIILLIPLIIYLCLLLVNIELVKDFQTLNIFGALHINAPIILLSSIFIALYALLIYMVYSGIHSFQAFKIKKLKQEIQKLQSELYSNQKELLDSITEKVQNQIADFKQENDKKFETMIHFNQYTLEKVIDETSGSFLKYRKETQKLLKESGVDQSFLDKIKFWEK